MTGNESPDELTMSSKGDSSENPDQVKESTESSSTPPMEQITSSENDAPTQKQPLQIYIVQKRDRRGMGSWLLNIVWLVFAGWHMFLTWFSVGLALCLTIVGIPCGYQIMKLAMFRLLPFGLKLEYNGGSSGDSNAHPTNDDKKSRDVRQGRGCFCSCCGPSMNCFLNVLWAVTVGWILACQAFMTAILLCCTIVGIPLAKPCFQCAWLSLRPFGLTYTSEDVTVESIPTTNDPDPHLKSL